MTATDLRNINWLQGAKACGSNLNTSADAEQSAKDTSFKYHIGTSVCHHDARHMAAGAKVWFPFPAARRSLNQAARLDISPSMEVGEVIGAFCSSRCFHRAKQFGDQTRVM